MIGLLRPRQKQKRLAWPSFSVFSTASIPLYPHSDPCRAAWGAYRRRHRRRSRRQGSRWLSSPERNRRLPSVQKLARALDFSRNRLTLTVEKQATRINSRPNRNQSPHLTRYQKLRADQETKANRERGDRSMRIDLESQ